MRARWPTRQMPRRCRSMAPTRRWAPHRCTPLATPAKTWCSAGPFDGRRQSVPRLWGESAAHQTATAVVPAPRAMKIPYLITAPVLPRRATHRQMRDLLESSPPPACMPRRDPAGRDPWGIERARFDGWCCGSSLSRRSSAQRSMATCTGRSTASRSPPRPSSTEQWRHAAHSPPDALPRVLFAHAARSMRAPWLLLALRLVPTPSTKA